MNRKSINWIGASVAFIAVTAVFVIQRIPDAPPAGPLPEPEVAAPAAAESTPGPAEAVAQSSPPAASPDSPLDAILEGAYDTEIVNGIRVRKDRNCTMQIQYRAREDGTVVESHDCVPNDPPAPDPYERYSSEALLTLSYSDPRAAETLGMRLREDDIEMAMSLIFRASALSGGRVEPIYELSDNYPSPSFINDVPVEETIRAKFLFSAVSEMLGGEGHGIDEWRTTIAQSFDNPDEVLFELDSQAWRIVEEMRQIELDVTGRSQIVLEGGDPNGQ